MNSREMLHLLHYSWGLASCLTWNEGETRGQEEEERGMRLD